MAKVTKKTARKKAAGARATAGTKARSGSLSGVSSEAVEKATGKGWDHWLRVLDRAGAQDMTHKEIAALLHEKHGVSAWWSQSLTVGYEQARGMREKHEKPDGFAISASKTISVPVSRAFRAWEDESERAVWLPGTPMMVRKATKDKTIRITWDPDGKGPAAASNVEVYFWVKGTSKCQVAVQHGKLKTAAAGEKLKKWWGERLAELKEMLEEGER